MLHAIRRALFARLWSRPGPRAALLCLVSAAAWVWRRALVRTRVIAVTGSVGKTTAKELLAGVLQGRHPVAQTRRNQNDLFGVPRSVLRIRPWHRFAVVEVGVGAPGQMRRLARIVRPDMVVLLGIARTHSTRFRDLDEHAAEKAVLVRHLPRNGWCLAWGDDPRAAAIARSHRGPSLLFGRDPAFPVWADGVRAAWPARLSFRAHSAGGSHAVQTRLVGAHWLPSVLGALAAAARCGVPLDEAARGVAALEPFPGRMSPMPLPSGAVVLRDDYNASRPVLDAALEVLRQASARRRILVLSDFSDFDGNRRHRLRYVAEHARGAADICVLIGEEGAYGRRQLLEQGFAAEAAVACATLAEATAYLARELRDGDLALLKGRTTDHVSRVAHALVGPVACRRAHCAKTVLCDFCVELRPPAAGQSASGGTRSRGSGGRNVRSNAIQSARAKG